MSRIITGGAYLCSSRKRRWYNIYLDVCWCRHLRIISSGACMLSAAALLLSYLEAALQAMRLFSRPLLAYQH